MSLPTKGQTVPFGAILCNQHTANPSPPTRFASSSKSANILLCGKGYPLFIEQQRYLESLGHKVTLLARPTNTKHALSLLTQHLSTSAMATLPYDAVLCSSIEFSKCLATTTTTSLARLRVVSYASSGVPAADIALARQHSIAVTNVPSETAHSTADLAVGLLLATARRFRHTVAHWQHRSALEREQDAQSNNALGLCGGTKDVHGARVGIVGFGNIGRQIARRLSLGFACQVRYFCGEGKPRKPCDVDFGASHARSMDELVRDADFVVASCPLNESTRGMFDERLFRKMRSDAVFINVGRGGLCVTPHLVRALKQGWIGAAGLDVTDPEPLPREHQLWAMQNVTITPHIGTATVGCRTRMMRKAVENLLTVLEEQTCANVL